MLTHDNLRIMSAVGTQRDGSNADQSTTVKGMVVHPTQLAEVCRRHAEVGAARLCVQSEDNYDAVILPCEVTRAQDKSLREAVTGTLRDVVKLRGAVQFVDTGSLPNAGLVIEDRRSYD